MKKIVYNGQTVVDFEELLNNMNNSGGADLGPVEIVQINEDSGLSNFASLEEASKKTIADGMLKATEKSAHRGTLIVSFSRGFSIAHIDVGGSANGVPQYSLNGMQLYMQDFLWASRAEYFTYQICIQDDGTIFSANRIDFKDMVISNILTTENTTEYTPSADYHPANKKYVDEAILALGGVESFVQMEQDNIGFSSGNVNITQLGNNYGQILADAVVEATGNGTHRGVITTTSYNGMSLLTVFAGGTANGRKVYSMNGLQLGFQATLDYSSINFFTYQITIDSNGNFYRLSQTDHQSRKIGKLLTYDNTLEYTPTADYHPANKKYVDELVNSRNVLAGTYNDIDVTAGYDFSVDEVNDLIDTLNKTPQMIQVNLTREFESRTETNSVMADIGFNKSVPTDGTTTEEVSLHYVVVSQGMYLRFYGSATLTDGHITSPLHCFSEDYNG